MIERIKEAIPALDQIPGCTLQSARQKSSSSSFSSSSTSLMKILKWIHWGMDLFSIAKCFFPLWYQSRESRHNEISSRGKWKMDPNEDFEMKNGRKVNWIVITFKLKYLNNSCLTYQIHLLGNSQKIFSYKNALLAFKIYIKCSEILVMCAFHIKEYKSRQMAVLKLYWCD